MKIISALSERLEAMDYYTISDFATSSFTEKKSEFIGDIAHVTTPQEATCFISDVKKMHKNAKHYCYVYILREDSVMRYSDDGEPQGKAAIPMLEVLKANNLTDVCLVVTRYFALTVENSEILHMIMCKSIVMTVDYSMYDKLVFYFSDFKLNQTDTQYSDKVRVYIDILSSEYEKFCEVMKDKSFGKCVIELIEEKFSGLPELSQDKEL
jgi:putative IMPACT (imprinted ancient) family translation regulator